MIGAVNMSRGAVNNSIGAVNNLQWIFQHVDIVQMHINIMIYSLQIIHCTYEIIDCTPEFTHCTWNTFTMFSRHLWQIFTNIFISVFMLPYILCTSCWRPLSEGFRRLPFLYSRGLHVRFQKVFTDCHFCIFEDLTWARLSYFIIPDTWHAINCVVELGTEMH